MEEVTFYFFLSHTKAYLKQLLTEPSSAKVDDELLACLKSIGLSQEDFLKCLLDKDIIERKESVDDDIYNGHEKATFSIKYQVPRKNFERKLQKLHIELFSEDFNKPRIDENTKKVIGFPADLIHGGKLRMNPWDTGLDMENWALYHENLDEATIRSYPTKNIIANLMNTFAIGAPDWYIEKVHTGIVWEKNGKVFILLKPSEDLSTAVKNRMYDFGWDCCHDGNEKTFNPEESKIIGGKYMALVFDKKFNEDDFTTPRINKETGIISGFNESKIHGGTIRTGLWDDRLDMENREIYNENIDEAIIRTYPIKNVLSNIRHVFNLGAPDWYVDSVNAGFAYGINKDLKIFVHLKPENEDEADLIADRMYDFGWNLYQKEVSNQKVDKRYPQIPPGKYIVMVFDKKFNEDVTEQVITYGKLYHFCKESSLPKIEAVGLCPKLSNWVDFNGGELDNTERWKPENQKKNYARIYFFTNKNAIDPTHYFKFKDGEKDEEGKQINNNKYCQLEIDPSKCGDIKFYYDPRQNNAVYTFDNVPPQAIKVIDKEFTLNEDGEGGGATAADASGQFSQPLFGEPIKRKIYVTKEQFERLKEAVEVDNRFGEFGYDAPGLAISKDDPTMKHRKKNGGISWEHAEEEKK